MKATETRLCIYPKDIQRITGKSERYGRRLIKKIRERLGKTESQLVTIEEFSNFTGIQKEHLFPYLL